MFPYTISFLPLGTENPCSKVVQGRTNRTMSKVAEERHSLGTLLHDGDTVLVIMVHGPPSV